VKRGSSDPLNAVCVLFWLVDPACAERRETPLPVAAGDCDCLDRVVVVVVVIGDVLPAGGVRSDWLLLDRDSCALGFEDREGNAVAV